MWYWPYCLREKGNAGSRAALKELLVPGFLWALPLYVIPAGYYLFILYRYGVIYPGFPVLHYDEFIQSGFYVAPDERIVLGVYDYVRYFARQFLRSWVGIFAHQFLLKANWSEAAGMLVVIALAVAGFFVRSPGEDGSARGALLVGRVGALTVLVVLILHIQSSYGGHLAYGNMGGAQSRYYLPLLPVLPILAIHSLGRIRDNVMVVGAALAISLQLLYSDFFYFLAHWGQP